MGTILLRVDCEDVRLARLLQLYIHEFSAVLPIPIGGDALFTYDELPLYTRDASERVAYLFVDGDTRGPLGFALASFEAPSWHVEEFFVIAGARGRGIGAQAAAALFADRPGHWTLTVRPENPGALKFWRAAAGAAEEHVEVGERDGVRRTRLSFVK